MGVMGACPLGMGLVGPTLLVLLGGLIGGAVLRWREPAPGRGASGVAVDATEDRAMALLRERFARGEIDQAEYERRRGTLAREMGWV